MHGPVFYRLTVSGLVVGKARPRLGRGGRVYTPDRTVDAEGRVIAAWELAGRPHLSGPIHLKMVVWMGRPQGHFRKDGGLSALGRRTPVPLKRPDLDNVLKLVADALNGRAYGDDSQITRVLAVREWAPVGTDERIDVFLRRL
jgi:Holliday junction resolvase RusA-like endonuclease